MTKDPERLVVELFKLVVVKAVAGAAPARR